MNELEKYIASVIADDSFDNLILQVVLNLVPIISMQFVFNRKTNKELSKFNKRQLRLELYAAIDHDYGIERVEEIFKDYKNVGGNGRGTRKYMEYIDMKAKQELEKEEK